MRFFTVLFGLTLAGAALAAGAQVAGRLILLQGEVSVRPSGAAWQEARLNQDLSPGDMVRTGANSRAAILCLDESQIKLNENTVLVLKNVAPSPRVRLGEVTPAAPAPGAASVYQVLQGEIWLRNKKEEFLFELETPTVTATIRGTELNVRVQPNGTTSVILLEGRLKLSNPYGEVVLMAGEEGITRPGQAPTKRVLVQPTDAVQWSLYYPGYFNYRDLPLKALEAEGPPPGAPSALAALLNQGVEAYDQGRLGEAGEAAERALAQDHGNPRALILAGWVSLQRRQPEEALGYFRRVPQPGAAAIVGAALARYQLGDALRAYLLLQSARPRNPGPPILTVMEGYFAMLVGKAEEARGLLSAAAESPSPVAQLLARCYLAQMDIVQNRKGEARSQADRALALNSASPLAQLTRALVDIADFQLPAAQRRLEKALEVDPRFVDAAVYLSRIYLGGDYFNKARRTMEQALNQAPRDPSVLALAGFVSLAFRDYKRAQDLFARSIRESPRLGEPHLGLSLCHFRYRQFDQGLTEMLTATLLDPRMSSYQSELGKAFYQVRAFDKALETWNYAATLDPRDPTPHFYKGIALTDLNRPGEAVQAINQSIALNDHRAVFRPRLMLDRDQSARNYNLARAYDQLGLGEWALSKALTAVKLDPLNSSPHLFLANSYLAGSQRVVAYNAEELLYRVLSPATQTTFRYLLNNDYTSMFEMPYIRATVQGGVGSWEERKTIQDHFVAAYGGAPGVAFYGEGRYGDDRGFRKQNGFFQDWNAIGLLKWEPTVHGNLTGFFQYMNQNFGDTGPINDFFYRNESSQRQNFRFRAYELSYLHRFTPNWALLAYVSFHSQNDHLFMSPFNPYFGEKLYYIDAFDWNYHNIQVQQQVILGKHTLIGGFDYFYGPLHFQKQGSLFFQNNGLVIPLFSFYDYIRPPEKTYSFYLLDYWRLAPWLLVELGVFRDVTRNARSAGPRPVTNSLWSPRVGVNIQINAQHTLRLAIIRYLNTHVVLQPLLVPTEVAGLPWPVDTKHGAEVRAAGASWEAQWDDKTFTVLRLDAIRVASPEYLTGLRFTADPDNPVVFYNYGGFLGWRRYQASLFLNRILTNSLGLTLGVTGKRVFPDAIYQPDLWPYTEVNGLLGLSFLTPKGWQGGVRALLVYQHLRERSSDNLFTLVNLRFGKELANKRGLISVEVQNLFNRHFGYLLEPSIYSFTPDFYPARRLVGKIALYF